MTPDDLILAFARAEAGSLPVRFKIENEAGDGYVIERKGQGHLITGSNARSCLHGLYHLQMGRPAGKFKSAFGVRGINTCESLARHTPEEMRLLIDRMGHWRMNALVVHVSYGWRRQRDLIIAECAKRGIDLVFYVYANLAFLPPDAPARWFAKREDGTPITKQLECETRLCLAEPEGLRASDEGAERFFRDEAGPAASLVATTGDGYSHCRCPRCRSLSPTEQFQPILKNFIDTGRRLVPGKRLESLIYVNRYRPPAQMAIHNRLDAVLFDDHVRMRWRALGEEHPAMTNPENYVDPSSVGVPINVYLADRLAEWRAKFHGGVAIFDNLQLHSTCSCPQPNTGALLRDMRRASRLGVGGMIFEMLTGPTYFLDQMGVLSDVMWNLDIPYQPSRSEGWCSEHCPPGPLFFLESYGFPWKEFRGDFEETLQQHMHNLRELDRAPSGANVKKLIEHMYRDPLRFDRQATAFRYLKQFNNRTPVSGLTPAEANFLARAKLWDVMEPMKDPIAETDAIVQGILRRL